MGDLEEYRGLKLDEIRDRVMDDLAYHYSVEDLGMEEYDERCGKAAAAARREDLVALLADLPAIRKDESPAPAAPTGISFNRGRVPGSEPIVNIFFGTDRKGVWKPARNTAVVNIFGGANLDLRKALIPPEGMDIFVVCLFGGCEIVLPEGMSADVAGIGLFGGFNKNLAEAEEDEKPLLRVRGVAMFGGVDVKTGTKRP